MATIDERIVSMVFENTKFEAGIATSMASLKKFNDALSKTGQTTGFSDIDKAAGKVSLSAPMTAISKLQGYLGRIGVYAGQGFSDIDKAGNKVELTGPITALNKVQTAVGDVGRNAPDAFNEIEKSSNRVDFAGLTSALSNVQSQFSVMSGAAAVALGNIYTKAAEVGAETVKALTLEPITEGFHNYETQINAVQTILANTGLKGKAGLNQVNAALQDLNNYANLTVYNFSEMAKNIGTFTAAGVPLKEATGSIKGIANLAAMSGATSQQASSAMYQLSQAIAAGQVHLQDWNSVVNAGMGGQVFQKALMNTAVAMGTIEKSAYKVDKATGKATINGQNFRTSLQSKPGQQSWLTSKVLTTTLNNFTGDVSKAQLAAEGFTKSQIKTIQDQAQTAVKAATNIKTATQLFQALKEEVASSWSQVWKTLFGDINGATKLFSALHNYIENMLRGPVDKFNKVLMAWAKMGGRGELLAGLKQAWQDLLRIIDPIKQAFRDIFPPETAKGLLAMTDGFAHLMDRLKASSQTMDDIRRTFRGVFAIFDIVKTVIVDVVKTLASLLGVVGKGSGGLLHFTGSLGDFLVMVDRAVSKGKVLNGFFNGLKAVISVPLKLIGLLVHAIGGLFSGGVQGAVDSTKKSFDGMSSSVGTLGDKFGPVIKLAEGFYHILEKIKDKVAPVVDKIADEVGRILNGAGSMIKNADFNAISGAISTGVLGGILLALKKGLGKGLGELHLHAFTADLKNLDGVFHSLTGNLVQMQKLVQAVTLASIAIALGILAGAIFVLARLDPKRLGMAMTAIAVGLGELMGAMRLMTTGLGKLGILMLPFISASLIGLATALVILSAAVKIFSTMSWPSLIKGLAGVGLGLAAIGLGLKGIGPSIILIGPGLLIVATALTVLSGAMKIFSTLSWGGMIKGLIGIAGGLTALGIGLDAIGPSVTLVGPGLLITSVGLLALAAAVSAFGHMHLGTLAKGILGVSAALIAIGLAVAAIPPTVALQGAGILVLSVALDALAGAVYLFGKMSIITLIKGILAMGAALVVLAAGLIAMEAGLPGAAALTVAAAGLALIAPALALLGNLNISTIVIGLAAIAGVFTVLGVAGTLAAAPITALGIAMLPFAGALVLAAGATFVFAKAIGVLASVGGKGLAVLLAAITGFALLLPKLVFMIIKGFVDSIESVALVLPKIVDALDKILTTVIAFIIREAPKIATAIVAIVETIAKVLDKAAPKLLEAGLKLLVTFLSGIAKNIGKVTDSVALILVNFLNALSDRTPDIIDAGAHLIGSFLHGIASKIGDLAARGVSIVTHFIGGIISKIPDLMGLGVKLTLAFIRGVASNVKEYVIKGVDIILNFLSGIASQVPKVIKRGIHIASMFIHGVASGLVKMADTGAQAIIDFLNGMANTIRKRSKEIWQAGFNLADAIMQGMVYGLKQAYKHLPGPVKDMMHVIISTAKAVGKIVSPSKVFHEIGGFIVQGLANGLSDHSGIAEKSMANTTNNVIQAAKKAMTNVPGLLDEIVDTNPKITPVLDLSHIKKHARELSDITNTAPITATLSGRQATAISHEKATVDRARVEAATHAAKSSVKYEQNIYSPEPLSTVEIYRRTHNQLSQMRREIGVE